MAVEFILFDKEIDRRTEYTQSEQKTDTRLMM